MDNKKKNGKIYIVGTGIYSCIGTNIDDYAKSLRNGICGLYHDPACLEYGYQSDLRGSICSNLHEVRVSLSRAEKQCMSLISLYTLNVVRQSLKEAGITDEYLQGNNVSIIVSNDSTVDETYNNGVTMEEWNDTRRLGAGAVFRSLNSTVSMNLATILGIHGLSLTVSAACAGGGHAIGLGKMLIDTKQTDMVIVIGVQEDGASSMQAFDALGVFTQDEVKPFDKNRDGLAPSGGAACIILESESSLRRRKQLLKEDKGDDYNEADTPKPLAMLSGYGFSTNGNAISTPDSYQEEVSMLKAIESASLDEGYIDVVLAHATGTPMGDDAEAKAIERVFTLCPHVVATKGMTGHECWMAGVSQAVQATIMLQHHFLPGSVGTEECEYPNLRLVMNTMQDYQPHHILCNAFGFGGTNSSFIISKVE